MEKNTFESRLLLEPWESTDINNAALDNELYKELCEGHVLYGIKVKAIARKCDDVLFYLYDNNSYATVHLTWKGKKEESILWPTTNIFSSFEEWKIQCMIPDYLDYADILHTFEVKEANKRINNQIALYGIMSSIIKPGDYLINKNNICINYRVKGIECLSYIDKENNYRNPWVIIEGDINAIDEFIGENYIIGANE